MEKYFIIFLVLGLSSVDPAQGTCESDVNLCTADFTMAQEEQARSGFNLTAICSIVNEFMTCVNQGLAPCEVITRNTLRSAIDQLIDIYTNAPYGCTLEFTDTFEYGNCSQQVTKCAFFKYDAEELKDNATEACKEFDNFVDCMQTNTTACEGDEQVEINQSIQNTTSTFSRCPYACDQPDLVCTTVSSTTSASTTPAPVTETVFLSASPSLSSAAVSELDLSEYYSVTIVPSEDFYNPSEILTLYSGDVTDFYTAGISDDPLDQTALFESDDVISETYATLLATEDLVSETYTYDTHTVQPTSTSYIQVTQTQTPSSVMTYTASTTSVTSPAYTTTTLSTTTLPTTTTTPPTTLPTTTKTTTETTPSTPPTPVPSTTKSTQTTQTTTSKPTTSITSKAVQQKTTYTTTAATTRKDTTTSTTTTPTTTIPDSKSTEKASTEKETTKTSPSTKTPSVSTEMTKTTDETPSSTDAATPKTTTDFPTPNYDNAGVINRQSAIILLVSLLFAFMS